MNQNKPFTHHTKSAIRNNRDRKKYYSDLSNKKTKKISFLLNFFSYLQLPLTLLIDNVAKKYNKKGILILENDFIELSEINPKHQLVEKQNIISKELYNYIDIERKNYIKNIKYLLKNKELEKICEISDVFIKNIEEIEKNDNCNIPLTKHIVESVGFSALHGIEYKKQSNGKTQQLTIFIIKHHVVGLYNSLRWFDKKCQIFFSKNIGIIINDIPSIPFCAEWEKYYTDK